MTLRFTTTFKITKEVFLDPIFIYIFKKQKIWDVLNGIWNGKTTKEIAEELKISPKTVEFHRARMLSMFSVSGYNYVGLCKQGLMHGLLTVDATLDDTSIYTNLGANFKKTRLYEVLLGIWNEGNIFEIGKNLGISHKTVEYHRLVLYKKFKVNDNVTLCRRALTMGLLKYNKPTVQS